MAVGGMTTALVLALLVASIGSQTFYPREASVGMWCAIGLMMRAWVERKRAIAGAGAARKPPKPRVLGPRAASSIPGVFAASARSAGGRASTVVAGDLDARLWRRPEASEALAS